MPCGELVIKMDIGGFLMFAWKDKNCSHLLFFKSYMPLKKYATSHIDGDIDEDAL